MENIKDLKELTDRVTIRSDGFLEDKYTGLLYQKVSDTKAIPLISPRNGAYLIPNENGTFRTDYDSTTYFLGKDGNVIPQIDPYNRGEIDTINGKLISRYTGAEFTYDANREVYIPHYIPDESSEPAHIEGDYLVGNSTGRKFLIDTDGTILTPKEEYIKEIQRQQTENLKQMEEDGTFEEWFSERSKMPTKRVEKTSLELYLEEIKKHPENVTDEDLQNLTILMEKGELPDEIMQKINQKFEKKESIETSIGNFLSNISGEEELCDYLINLGISQAMIKQLHHLDPNFFEKIFTAEKDATIQFHDNGIEKTISISTTPNLQQSVKVKIFKDNKVSIQRQIHTPLLVDGIRTGETKNFSARMREDNSLVIVEDDYQLQLHSKEDLSFDAKATRTESIILPNGVFQQGNKKEASGICYLSNNQLTPISDSNKMDPLQIDNAYRQMTQLRQLGFDERFFNKIKIAGLSYDLEGNESYLDNEFQTEVKADEKHV